MAKINRVGIFVTILSAAVNYLLILAADRMAGGIQTWKRALPASVIGALFAGGCFVEGFAFLAQAHWRMVALFLMSWLAFGFYREAVRRWAIFMLFQLSLDGILSGEILAGVLCVLSVCLLCGSDLLCRQGSAGIVTVCIFYKGKKLEQRALIDTGNELRDPVSGMPVMIVDCEVARMLFNINQDDLAHPIETLTKQMMPGLRLIPYCSVGQPAGMLLGFRPDRVEVNGEKKDYIVAFAPQRLGAGKQYQALVGGVL